MVTVPKGTAAGRSRTDMKLPSQVFETCVSTNSTTAAYFPYFTPPYNNEKKEGCPENGYPNMNKRTHLTPCNQILISLL